MALHDEYVRKLRELRTKHAWEVVTQPQLGTRPPGEAYLYAIGFQSGLEQAEKLLFAVLNEEKETSK